MLPKASPPSMKDLMSQSRRDFLKNATLAGTSALVTSHLPAAAVAQPGPAVGRPIVVASANGLAAVTKAMEIIQGGADALDAVIAGVNIVEEDPNDVTVGYGGLPNEDGVVELDSAVMHGPTHCAGAVASLRNIKTPSKVARKVMERSDHVLLVGEGALKFARAHGFKEEDLLTEKAREAWLYWKEHLSTKDDWLPPHTPDDAGIGQALHPLLQDAFGEFYRHTGTIHCSALDTKGNLSCVTTTSGLAFKISGRVGDSPIIGAGLYVDNEVGSAGSTGRGEANLVNCSSVMIVEGMRNGKSPEEACLDACRRVVDHTKVRRLKDDAGRPDFNVVFYALNKKGEFGGASLYSGSRIAVHDGTEARHVPIAYLYKKQ
jgi:N4-(beta-N-acetylglucosaminyl)-L-asparaginase